jgi:hypothetical protein
MTENQIALINGLADCTFCPGIGTKRFARDMAFFANNSPERELTAKQYKYLCEAVIKFRRQIRPGLVVIARNELSTIQVEPDVEESLAEPEFEKTEASNQQELFA